MGKVELAFGKGLRVSKQEFAIYELLKDSRMMVRAERNDAGKINHLVIAVQGRAARVPSTSNSRLNMFHKAGTINQLKLLVEQSQRESAWRLGERAKKAIQTLEKTQVVSTINSEHKTRLEALTRLWERSVPLDIARELPLGANKDNRWLVTLHLHEDLHRVDTHNLTKPVCDWLQKIKVIENDKHVDCFPMRNVDIGAEKNNDTLYICLRESKEVTSEIRGLANAMLERNKKSELR